MSDLGAGLALTDEWDLEVDQTGDLRASTGLVELQKDIAFTVARIVEGNIGQPARQDTEKQIQLAVRDVLVDEPRIDGIRRVNVRRIGRNNDGFEVVANIDTATGPFELVFEVAV